MAGAQTSLKVLVVLVLSLYWTISPVRADSPQTDQPQEIKNFIYTVQPGDTLVLIALRYNLTLAEIVLANNLLNPNLIFPGQQLILPGPPPPPAPAPLVSAQAGQLHIVQPGETLLSLADLYHVSLAELMALNNLNDPYLIHLGQTLKVPAGPASQETFGYPFAAVALSEPTISQGRTLVIRVTLAEPAVLSGSFMEQPLFFYESSPRQFWSLAAIHALIEPNSYPLSLTATMPDGRITTKIEYVQVVEGPYGSETILLDNTRTQLLAPELVELELQEVKNVWSQVSPRPRWEGPFWYPVGGNAPRITSYFGTRRHYNTNTDLSFHGGTDFGGGIGAPIYAAAPGRVALAKRLTVRGNAVLIDHGLGLYSGYWHQSQIVVVEGQEVRQGDLIGYIGDTGLVTGPHLHWELRLNGVAVNPLQWVQESLP